MQEYFKVMEPITNVPLTRNLTPTRLHALTTDAEWAKLTTDIRANLRCRMVLLSVDADTGWRCVDDLIETDSLAGLIIWVNKMRKQWLADGLSLEVVLMAPEDVVFAAEVGRLRHSLGGSGAA